MRTKPQEIITTMDKVDHIIHISDIHIRKRERHDEYRIVFERLYLEVLKYPNSLVVITGDTVHDKTELVPESIDVLRRLLIKLTEMVEVVIIVGNHDVNIFNVGSLDSLTPIITDLRTEKPIHILNEDRAYRFGKTSLVFGVTTIWANSVTDIDNYDLSHIDTPLKIALYHGMIHGCTLDNGVRALNSSRCTNSSYFNVSDFASYDLTLLGDVHKHQFLNANRTMAYAGSLIQQKRDEDLLEHGYILWRLQKLEGEFIRIPSDYGMIEIDVPDDVNGFIERIQFGNTGRPRKSGRLVPAYSNSTFPPNLDIKLKYSTIEARESFKKIYDIITDVLGKNIVQTSEFMFSKNTEGFEAGILREIIEFGRSEPEDTESTKKRVTKTDKKTDINEEKSENDSQSTMFKVSGNRAVLSAIMGFYDKKFKKKSDGGSDVGSEQTYNPKTRELIREEIADILKDVSYNYESDVKNIRFKSITFDNMFIYLDQNEIDFSSFEKIVGINAGNFRGKSSFIDIILYAIYGKCSRGKRFDILNIKKNSMMSRICLEVNSVEYIITRNSYVNSRKNRDLKESVVFCENGRDITADDRVKTHKLIESKICSYSDMVNNSFILQKNGSSFTDLTDRQKKDLLCKMARLDVFDRVFHEAKSRHFSHSQNFGKTVRRLDPLMNKYLSVKEIQSILPKNKTKKSGDESNQRKLDLIHDKLIKISKELEFAIRKYRKQIMNHTRKLTRLEKEESILSTEEMYEEQNRHTVDTYRDTHIEIDRRSAEIVSIIDKIRNYDAELNNILQNKTEHDLQIEYRRVVEDNQKRRGELNNTLLHLHTRLHRSDRTEREILDSLAEKRETLIDLQDRLINQTKERERLQTELSDLRDLRERDTLILETVDRIEQLDRSIQDRVKSIRENTERSGRCEESLQKLKTHRYNPDCEQCMSNPVTQSILQYEDEIHRLQENTENMQKEVKNLKLRKKKESIVSYEGKIFNCSDSTLTEEVIRRPSQLLDIEKRHQSILNNTVDLESKIQIIRTTIDREEEVLEALRKNHEIIEEIDKINKMILEIQTDTRVRKLEETTERVKTLIESIGDSKRELRSHRERITDLTDTVKKLEKIDIPSTIIRLIERGDLDERLDRIRESIREHRSQQKKLEQNLASAQTELNEITLDLERFGEIREAIQSESNSKLVLEQIKKLLDRSGLVDHILTSRIIPYIQNRINSILSDVGHYQIEIVYKNQNVNIYKSDGLNISMSSGYESYLLDLVFRLALVQINNHIRTDFLVIDEGFNACDVEHKNNIRDLLEYMRTYYSWILVISHDDYIKSFYDNSIDIQAVTGIADDTEEILPGSRIRNVETTEDTDLQEIMDRIKNVKTVLPRKTKRDKIVMRSNNVKQNQKNQGPKRTVRVRRAKN